MGYVLGVDGGASKTHAIISTEDGVVVGFGAAGGSNIYILDPALAITNVIDAVNAARTMASLKPSDIRIGAFSMSGADWPEDFVYIEGRLAESRLADSLVVVNDAIGGLRSGVPQGPGVAVICGTGVATAGAGESGELWFSGFWQGKGGAMDLARSTLDAVFRAELGLGKPTTLTERVLAAFSLSTTEEVLRATTCRHGKSQAAVLTLPGILLDEADQGDETACRLVEDHGHTLGDYAIVAARKVHILDDEFPLVLAGGVLRHRSHLLADAITSRVREEAPHVLPIRNCSEPVIGAVIIALQEAGIDVTPSRSNTLFQTADEGRTMWARK